MLDFKFWKKKLHSYLQTSFCLYVGISLVLIYTWQSIGMNRSSLGPKNRGHNKEGVEIVVKSVNWVLINGNGYGFP